MTISDTMPNRLFVTGTDTDVGKSVLSLLMVHCCLEAGLHPVYLKPLQTGCVSPRDAVCDARFVFDHIAKWSAADPADAVVYCFPAAKAPYFAARDQGATIDPKRLIEAVAQKADQGHPLIIEGAGGLLVPVTETLSTVDLLPRLEAVPVLAARAGLGTINHTLLSLELLRQRGITPAGVILLDGATVPTPADMVAENKAAIEGASGVPVAGVVHHIADFHCLETVDLAPVRRLLGLEVSAKEDFPKGKRSVP